MESKEVLLFNQYKIALEKYKEEQSDLSRRKLVYWAVRCIPYIDDIEDIEVLIQLVDMQLKKMTYRDLVNMFPIDKRYDGDKWDTKDYFYTINYIKDHGGLDTYIEDPFDMIWDYQNKYIRKFGVKWIDYVNDKMEDSTGIDVFEAFFHTDDIAKDSKGNLIGINKNGEVCKVANPHNTRPHLAVVK